MNKKKSTKKPPTTTKKAPDYVVVKNKSYGKSLFGTKIYFEGKKPNLLQADGSIRFGKNILEVLKVQFKDQKFRWIITQSEDSIAFERGIHRIKTSQRLLGKMNNELYARTRDIKNDIIRNEFSKAYAGHFSTNVAPVYTPGKIEQVLTTDIIPRLSSGDRQAILDFLPDFIGSESHNSVNLLKAEAEIKSLKDLAKDLEKAINNNHAESWWQKYIEANILIIQQGYIKPIQKMNISIGNVKFPDFSLVTHDDYLDIFEIKKPSTQLMKFDHSRNNYYWDSEMARAIIQAENYIETVSVNANAVRSYLKDHHAIELKVLRPRGIILAGNAQTFANQKEKDDFRLLSQGLKNISILTYDELLVRLQNYTKVLEGLKKRSPKKKTGSNS